MWIEIWSVDEIGKKKYKRGKVNLKIGKVIFGGTHQVFLFFFPPVKVILFFFFNVQFDCYISCQMSSKETQMWQRFILGAADKCKKKITTNCPRSRWKYIQHLLIFVAFGWRLKIAESLFGAKKKKKSWIVLLSSSGRTMSRATQPARARGSDEPLSSGPKEEEQNSRYPFSSSLQTGLNILDCNLTNSKGGWGGGDKDKWLSSSRITALASTGEANICWGIKNVHSYFYSSAT